MKSICHEVLLVMILNHMTKAKATAPQANSGPVGDVDVQDYKIKLYPANIYLFKVNNRNTRKGVKYVQS